jgi:hypothetical protein
MHAPPIGPWADWFDDELLAGVKAYQGSEEPRGSVDFAWRTGNQTEPLKGHPLFAIRPKERISSDPVWGMDASYNSFERRRPWFITRVSDTRFGVRLVLSGHIHRSGLFAVYRAGKGRSSELSGKWLVQAVTERLVAGVHPPAVTRSPVERDNVLKYAPGPLYVNTTSAGPRGHSFATRGSRRYVDPGYALIDLASTGTIQRVQFRAVPARRDVGLNRPEPAPASRRSPIVMA